MRKFWILFFSILITLSFLGLLSDQKGLILGFGHLNKSHCLQILINFIIILPDGSAPKRITSTLVWLPTLSSLVLKVTLKSVRGLCTNDVPLWNMFWRTILTFLFIYSYTGMRLIFFLRKDNNSLWDWPGGSSRKCSPHLFS